MSAYPPADRKAHQDFCETEGWSQRRSARGKKGQDHLKYELPLEDGRVLRTRISHPPNRTTYAPSMWAHILRDQLDVSEEEFWACVNDGALPERGSGTPKQPSLPLELVHNLRKAGIADHEIAGMSLEEATARMTEIWSRPAHDIPATHDGGSARG